MPNAWHRSAREDDIETEASDDAVDLVVEDLLEDALDVPDGRRGHEDQDMVALLLERDRQALDHLRVEVVLEVGDDEADDPAASGDQGAGQHVGPVAELRPPPGAPSRRCSCETEAPGVKTRETADWLTPARLATSRDVILSLRHQSAVQPPSTRSAVPVTSAEASEARKTTAPMMSSTSTHAAELDLLLEPGAALGVRRRSSR